MYVFVFMFSLVISSPSHTVAPDEKKARPLLRERQRFHQASATTSLFSTQLYVDSHAL